MSKRARRHGQLPPSEDLENAHLYQFQRWPAFCTSSYLVRVKHEVMEMLEKDGVDENIGRDHIHSKVGEAVQWFTQNKKDVVKG